MNNKKGFGALGIILVIVVVIIVAYGAYYAGVKSSSKQQVSENLVTPELTKNDTDLKAIPTSSPKITTPSSVVATPTPVKNIAKPQIIEKVQVYVNVIDMDGKPFKSDTVEWYYPLVNGQTTQYPAKCVNSGCTRWSVTGANASKIYVVANYTAPHAPEAQCFKMAYDAKPVELSTVPAEITLTMKLDSYCY